MGLLETIKKGIKNEKNKLVLVEQSMPEFTDSSREESAQEILTDIFEQPMFVESMGQEGIDQIRGNPNYQNALFLVNAIGESKIPSIISLFSASMDSLSKIQEIDPEAQGVLLVKGGHERESASISAQNKLLSFLPRHMAPKELVGVGYDAKGDGIEILEDQLSSIKHKLGDQRNHEFIGELSEAYLEGNLQAATDKSFAFITRKRYDSNGKFDMINPNDALEIDFSKYAAIIIDNEFNFKGGSRNNIGKIGGGINTLERLVEQGKELPPIIYQTAHNLDSFTDEEKERIRLLGATLLPKNTAPKVCPNPESAIKELEASRILRSDPSIKDNVVQTIPVGENGYIEDQNGLAVTFSQRADPSKINEDSKRETFTKLGLEDNIHNTRAYVLAGMHSNLREHVDNPTFTPTVDKFLGFGKLKSALGDQIAKYEKVYEQISTDPKNLREETIAHNDAKPDNWFGETILGDFSNAGPGMPYKDIARSLFDGEESLDIAQDFNKVGKVIDAYVSLAKDKDSSNDTNRDQLSRGVAEAIFSESLRIAYFKQERLGEEAARPYLDLAKQYHDVLQFSSIKRLF